MKTLLLNNGDDFATVNTLKASEPHALLAELYVALELHPDKEATDEKRRRHLVHTSLKPRGCYFSCGVSKNNK